jgi:23S rRNA (cytidine1920-2'-O)/16S rRNA (cytidine1409-2'-O)-methyltransferase
VLRFAGEIGLQTLRTVASPIKGKKGNQEILAIFEYTPPFHGM